MRQIFTIAGHRVVITATADGCTMELYGQVGFIGKRSCSTDWIRLHGAGLAAVADYSDEWATAGKEPR